MWWVFRQTWCSGVYQTQTPPRFGDGDRWGRMVTDIGIDDEGNALRNLFTLVSDTRSTHFLSFSNTLKAMDWKLSLSNKGSNTKGGQKPILGDVYLISRAVALCSAYESIFSGLWKRIDGVAISNYKCAIMWRMLTNTWHYFNKLAINIAIKTKYKQKQNHRCLCWRQK